MESDKQILRIEFSGEWWSFEMAEFLDAIDELYADFLLLDVADQLANRMAEAGADNITLRLHIDRLLNAVLESSVNSSAFVVRDPFVFEMEQGLERPVPLQVLKLVYGSDGAGDVFGLGRIVEAVASVINRIFDHFEGRGDRELKQLELIDRKVEIAKKAGRSGSEAEAYRQELLSKHDRVFRKLLESKRITKEAKLLPPPKDVERRIPPLYWT